MEHESNENSDEEEIVAKPEFVQILAPLKEINCWISSFIEEKRKHINLHNIQDFCVLPDQRQNCARVDAVLVKRKNTTSHITVKDIKNYCGPQEQANTSLNFEQSVKTLPTKKVFSSSDVEEKLKRLQGQSRDSCRSQSPN